MERSNCSLLPLYLAVNWPRSIKELEYGGNTDRNKKLKTRAVSIEDLSSLIPILLRVTLRSAYFRISYFDFVPTRVYYYYYRHYLSYLI